MKKNILRMLGIVLSLVMAFSLTAAFMPINQDKALADDDDNIWKEFKVPKQGTSGNWMLAHGTDADSDPPGSGILNLEIGPIAKSIDDTLYCYVGPSGNATVDEGLDGTDYTLFKSSPSSLPGREWSYVGKVKHTIVAIACSPVDADVLYYATNDSDVDPTNGDQPGVFKTSNAGGKWYEMLDITQATDAGWNNGNLQTEPTTGGTCERITSLDCDIIGDDHVVVVGTARGYNDDTLYGHVWVFDEGTRLTPAWSNELVSSVYDVWAVAQAPGFPDTRHIIGVVTEDTGTPVVTRVINRVGASGWGSEIANAVLESGNVAGATIPTTGNAHNFTSACLDFPVPFDSDPDSGDCNFYIGFNDGVPGQNYGGDLYEFVGVKKVDPPDTSTALDLAINLDVTDVIVGGPEGSCLIIAATNQAGDGNTTNAVLGGDDNVIQRSTDGGDTWKAALKEPTGSAAMCYLAKADDFADSGTAWAALGGRDGAVSLHVDDRLWNQIGLMNYEITYINDMDVAIGSDARLFISTDNTDDPGMTGGGIDRIFRHDGEYWEGIFSQTLEDCAEDNPGMDPELVQCSPGPLADGAVFLGDPNDTEKMFRSADAGQYFKAQVRDSGQVMTGFCAWDDLTVIQGYDDGIVVTNNNGKSWITPVPLDGAGEMRHFARSPGWPDDETILGGGHGEIWRSTDLGATWSELKYSLPAGEVWPAFDNGYLDNSTMYGTVYPDVATVEGGVWRYIKGTSTEWNRMDHKDGCPGATSTVTASSSSTVDADCIWVELAETGDSCNITELTGTLTLTADHSGDVTVTDIVAGSKWQVTAVDPMSSVKVCAGADDSTGSIRNISANPISVGKVSDADGDVTYPTTVDAAKSESFSLPDDASTSTSTTQTITDYEVNWGTGIVAAANSLYVTDSYAAGQGMSRSVNPTGALVKSPYVFWDNPNETIEGTLSSNLRGLWMTPHESDNELWTIFGNTKVYTLLDTLVKKVPLKTPKDSTSSGRVDQVTVEWDKLPDTRYSQLYVNTRSDFKGSSVLTDEDGNSVTNITTKGSNWVVPVAEQFTGIPLYWRVRVYQCEPYRSLYSDTWNFSTELKGAEWNPFRTAEGFAGNVAPGPGATDVPRKPTFQWNSSDWATAYELMLALNDAFTSPVASVTVTNPVWVSDVELKWCTVYFWKVRAISDLAESEWAVGTFTVVCEKEKPAPPIVIQQVPAPEVKIPPAPEPVISQLLVWVIIGIGVVLVICVVFLIISTRRRPGGA